MKSFLFLVCCSAVLILASCQSPTSSSSTTTTTSTSGTALSSNSTAYASYSKATSIVADAGSSFSGGTYEITSTGYKYTLTSSNGVSGTLVYTTATRTTVYTETFSNVASTSYPGYTLSGSIVYTMTTPLAGGYVYRYQLTGCTLTKSGVTTSISSDATYTMTVSGTSYTYVWSGTVTIDGVTYNAD